MLSINFTGFEQQIFWKKHPFTPKIYDGDGEPPQGFNAVRIVLDLSECSLLNWKDALLKAERSIQKGLLILWDLQFALFEGSLQDEARFLTLLLNVKHFNETVLFKFQEHSLGVSVFRGKMEWPDNLSFGLSSLILRDFDGLTCAFLLDNSISNMAKNLKLSSLESPDCEEDLLKTPVNTFIDYLKSLSASLPEEVFCFLFLDTTLITDRTVYFQVINSEIFGHFSLILKGPLAERYPYALSYLAWGHEGSCLGFCSTCLENTLPSQVVGDALCLSERVDNRLWESALDAFGSKPFRVIAENLLTQEWEGIDRLMIISQTLSEKGWRKIRGFEAAGGQIINFPDGVTSLQPQETSLLFPLVFSSKEIDDFFR